MLRIRFFRIGKKNQPFFRIVVTDRKNPPQGGRFLEVVGFFNPLTKEKQLKKERIEHWIKMGAQPSDRVHNLLVEGKITKGKKVPVHSKAKKKEEKTASAETPVEKQAPTDEKKEPIPSPESPAKEQTEQKQLAKEPTPETKPAKPAPDAETETPVASAPKPKPKPKEEPKPAKSEKPKPETKPEK